MKPRIISLFSGAGIGEALLGALHLLHEQLGAGASLINQYMFIGGTNLGEWAGRQVGVLPQRATTMGVS